MGQDLLHEHAQNLRALPQEIAKLKAEVAGQKRLRELDSDCGRHDLDRCPLIPEPCHWHVYQSVEIKRDEYAKTLMMLFNRANVEDAIKDVAEGSDFKAALERVKKLSNILSAGTLLAKGTVVDAVIQEDTHPIIKAIWELVKAKRERKSEIMRLRNFIRRQNETIKMDPAQSALATAEAISDMVKEPLECGHPLECFDEPEGTMNCSWCQDISEAEELRKAIEVHKKAGIDAGFLRSKRDDALYALVDIDDSKPTVFTRLNDKIEELEQRIIFMKKNDPRCDQMDCPFRSVVLQPNERQDGSVPKENPICTCGPVSIELRPELQETCSICVPKEKDNG